MRFPAGRPDRAAIRREAASWAAKMRGPEADRLRLDFERWRAASPLNRQLYADMEAISLGTQRLGGEAVAHNDDHWADGTAMSWRRPALIAAGAAALLLAGSAALITSFDRSRQPAMASATPLSTAVGQIRTVRLADGTSVVLDADSAVAPAFDGTARRVRLVRGRARFDVAHDAGRPFVVLAGDRVILDKGTVFDVSIGRGGVRVSLLRGAVEIHARADAPGHVGSVVARLAPGQTFADEGASAGRPVIAATDGAERWTSGMLSYDGAPLADVLADLGRYSTRKVRLADPALGDLRVTGVFKAVPVEGVAAALAAGLGLKVVTAANGDLILRR